VKGKGRWLLLVLLLMMMLSMMTSQVTTSRSGAVYVWNTVARRHIRTIPHVLWSLQPSHPPIPILCAMGREHLAVAVEKVIRVFLTDRKWNLAGKVMMVMWWW
jgi:hypothetical protein